MKRHKWTTLCAVDSDKNACATYKANFPDVDVRCTGVENAIVSIPHADVILAGFPCQPHSLAGKRHASADERDGGDTFVAAVGKGQPRQFLGENVPGILTSEGGAYVHRLVANLEAQGYVVQVRVLDAVDYGVPQFRARCFFWGIRRDLYDAGMRWDWPKRTHVDPKERGGMFGNDLPAWVTTGQALGIWYEGCGFDQRLKGYNGAQYREHGPDQAAFTLSAHGHYRYRWSDAMLAKHPPASPASHASTVQAKFFKGGAEGLVAYDHGVATAADPAPTLKAGGNTDRHGHQGGGCPAVLSVDTKQARTERTIAEPSTTVAHDDRRHFKTPAKYVRRLTPLECLRLQSGPDSFKWPANVTKTAQYRIVGNGQASAIMHHLALAFARVDPRAHTVVSLFSGGGVGDCGWHGRYWEYEAQ